MKCLHAGSLRFKLLDAQPNVRYVVTDAGRLSGSPYGNMSLSPNGYTPDATANREVAALVLGVKLSQCVFMQQRHTDRIEKVDNTHAGAGAYDYDSAISATDGLTTTLPSLGLFALAADCQSILLYAPDVPAVAAIHCGWRGTLQNIPQAAITALQHDYHACPERLIACLAPCIGPKAFEVKEDVASQFRKVLPNVKLLPHPDLEKKYIDLPQTNKQLLINAGVRPEHIEIQSICTYNSWPRFFSARRGDTGRFAVGIAIKENS